MKKIEIANINVFLDQTRTAWGRFEPNGDEGMPASLIVQENGSTLKRRRPDKEFPLFLPDTTTAVHKALGLHGVSIAAIDTKEAKRL